MYKYCAEYSCEEADDTRYFTTQRPVTDGSWVCEDDGEAPVDFQYIAEQFGWDLEDGTSVITIWSLDNTKHFVHLHMPDPALFIEIRHSISE